MNAPMTPKPFLYILMRTDMASMNPGKAVAQGAHAANQFVHEIQQTTTDTGTGQPDSLSNYMLYNQWRSECEGHGFGTTITLGVNEREMRQAVDFAKRLGFAAGVVNDPTYPLRDGEVTHLISVDTCGYIFGDKNELQYLLARFSLMP